MSQPPDMQSALGQCSAMSIQLGEISDSLSGPRRGSMTGATVDARGCFGDLGAGAGFCALHCGLFSAG
jgi:hypothetical protein